MAYNSRWSARLGQLAMGIDITTQGVMVVALRRGWRAQQPVRVEGLAWQPLPAGAVQGADLPGRAALTEALRSAVGQLPRACQRAALHCAMALPAQLTQVSSLPLEQLALDVRPDDDDALLTSLEPLALAEAERITGQERSDLAVDWCVEPGATLADDGEPVRCLTITAAPWEHLESRLECATAAGLTLCVMDGEAQAALRALRYMAALTAPAPPQAQAIHTPCVALWVGQHGLHGWALAANRAVRDIRYPSPDHATPADALRTLRGQDAPHHALLAGDPALLANWQMSINEAGDALGCSVQPFECAMFAARALPSPRPPTLLHTPACAVAFGLALRGVRP